MVLHACRTSEMELYFEKCSFLQKEANFLGRTVCINRYKADPAYVADVLKKPASTYRKELQSYLR